MKLRVLVACEFSATVREAFRARGHYAMSCDLLPSVRPGPHYQGDVFKVLRWGWDLMIAHPPCTYLAASGLHWNLRRPGRALLTTEAAEFMLELLRAPIPHIAIENPIGALSRISKPDQIVQPWQFGHDASKATCLWLVNLPLLRPTRVLTKDGPYWANQGPTGQSRIGPSADRWKQRSKTYQGVANAMAVQYSRALEAA